MIWNIDLNDCVMNNLEYLCWLFGLKLSDFYKWDSPLGPKVGMSNEDFLNVAYKTPSTQLAAKPNIGAAEALTALRSAGHTVNIVTATILTVDQIVNWLETYKIPFDNIIKSVVKLGGDLLIDDSPSTIAERMDRGLPTLKFNQPYNQNIDCPALDTWSDLQI